MIASLATMLFGTMTKLPDLVRSLVARQVTSDDAPFEVADLDPRPDAERLLALDRQAGEGVAERVLQREADDRRAHRRRRQQLVVEHEGRHQRRGRR